MGSLISLFAALLSPTAHQLAEKLEAGFRSTETIPVNQNPQSIPLLQPSEGEAPELTTGSQMNAPVSPGLDSLPLASSLSGVGTGPTLSRVLTDVDPETTASPRSTTLNSQPGATIPPGAEPVSFDSQNISKSRKCGCKCDPNCNCSCPCKHHCVCLRHACNQGCGANCQVKCHKECGSTPSRNLVVCLDGTSNQFGCQNTNVVELHSRVLKGDQDVPQFTFYSSGIGTYVPPVRSSPVYWLHVLGNLIDEAIAWHFKRNVEAAYEWLADHYLPGDRIYLFGFSRGAFQIRTLSGMIERLGLVFPGNKRLIPFGYELYANRHKGKKIKDEAQAEALAYNFKSTFSRPSVKVHFVGAWDTVSSVGITREQPLSLTNVANHACVFRHGLALDERRVKFLPEYFYKGSTSQFGAQSESSDAIDVAEVWFAGSHSDIGGGNRGNHLDQTCGLSRAPLSWMVNEASAAGLKFTPQSTRGEWRWGSLQKDIPTKSLKTWWYLFEYVPITRLSYTDETSTIRKLNRGHGRTIVPEQRVHASVAFMDSSYRPSASLVGNTVAKWEDLIGKGSIENLSWADADEWQDILDMDIYDDYYAQDAIQKLKNLRDIHSDVKVPLLKRLSFMALSYRGARRISEIIDDLVNMLSDDNDNVKATSASCLFRLAKHQYISWVLASDTGEKLKTMLYGNTLEINIASLQCLSQLVLPIKNTEDVSRAARVMLLAQPISWVRVLYEVLHSAIPDEQVVAISCLVRLVQDDRIREAWIKNIRDRQQDDGDTSLNLSDFVTRIICLLGKNQTEFYAAVVLRSVADDIHDASFNKYSMVSRLKHMIAKGHGKSKGAAVLCLSKVSEGDTELQKYILREHYIVTLALQLFGKKDHCRSCDIKSAIDAFLVIAKRAQELEQLEAIRAFSKVLCVDRWLPEREGSILLCELLSSHTLSSETKKKSVERLVTIGRDSDDAALGRTQVVFKALCNDDRTCELILENSVLQTILWALKCPKKDTRENAIIFLCNVSHAQSPYHSTSKGGPDLVSAQDSDEVRKLMRSRLSALLDRIVKLGKQPEDKEDLATVRKALRVFCYYDEFKDRLLDPTVLSVISKDINLKTANMHYGHGVHAQISGVQCWRELMKYSRVRVETYEKGLVNHLLDLYKALQEEPESSQWLRLWPDYERLLKKTLEDLVDDHDLFVKRAPLGSPLCERLRPFILRPPLVERERSAVTPCPCMECT